MASRAPSPVILIVNSQIALACGTLLAVILMPEGLIDNSGFSYYGVHLRTVIPYSLGIATCVYFLIQASKQLLGLPNLRRIGWSLIAFAFLLVVIMCTPYSVNNFFNDVHTDAGIALFVSELGLAMRVVISKPLNRRNLLLVSSLWLIGVVALLAQLNIINMLIEMQALFEIVFYILLIRVVRREVSFRER